MKINVTGSKQVWASPDGKVKIYDLTLDNGTVLQTMSGKISQGGEFDVEVYTNDKGKSYVRQLANSQQAPTSPDKQFKADPASRESIEWQTSLKAAIEVVRDYYMHHPKDVPADGPLHGEKGLESYCKEVDKAAVHFKNLINIKPTSTKEDTLETPEQVDEGIQDIPPVDDELTPPLEAYEGME